MLIGCSSGDLSEGRAWRLARERLPDATVCYRKTLAYCATDRELLDRSLEMALSPPLWRMPRTAAEIDRVVARARTPYRLSQLGTERHLVEAAIARNWNDPAVEQDGGEVTVKLGVPPGRLAPTGDLRLALHSPLVSDGELVPREAERLVRRFAERLDSSVFTLEIDIPMPDGLRFQRLHYRYFGNQDRVAIYTRKTPELAWLSAQLDAGATLRRSEMRRCDSAGYLAWPKGCLGGPG